MGSSANPCNRKPKSVRTPSRKRRKEGEWEEWTPVQKQTGQLELFPVPKKASTGVKLAEIRDLEDRFASGEITWAEYNERLRDLVVSSD